MTPDALHLDPDDTSTWRRIDGPPTVKLESEVASLKQTLGRR